ncbi:MAG TPA: sulfatase-like hydrolase/transferase, partial [Prolixibacteraceae bacterium]|nr:sulfatase-like hydrolase/transferase [Prolixibacteraceae bacterium]
MNIYLPIVCVAAILDSIAVQAQKVNPEIKEKKPNIILILTDDAGIGDFGINGNRLVQTPNLDKLAARSTRFTNFYVSPVCAPTRSSILTGNYAETTGVYDTYNGGA